jgi:hypothetical protein
MFRVKKKGHEVALCFIKPHAHTTEIYGGVEVWHQVFLTLVIFRLRSVKSRRQVPGTHWIVSGVNTRAGLKAVEETIPNSPRPPAPGNRAPAIQLVAWSLY